MKRARFPFVLFLDVKTVPIKKKNFECTFSPDKHMLVPREERESRYDLKMFLGKGALREKGT